MELLGEILHFSKSGRLIIKIENYKSYIKSGLLVNDNQSKKIGKIAEIIGPISSPYASIIPYIQKRNKMKGVKVYIGKNLNKSHVRKKKDANIKRNKK